MIESIANLRVVLANFVRDSSRSADTMKQLVVQLDTKVTGQSHQSEAELFGTCLEGIERGGEL